VVNGSGDAETIGGRLRRLRHDRRLSQRDLAGPGVSAAYISRIEAGQRRPSPRAVRLLAAKLGVLPEYLEAGREFTVEEERELRLSDAELQLRLAEDPSEAQTALAALLPTFEEAGDAAGLARIRAGLGLCAFRRGDYAGAIDDLERAVGGGSTSPLAHPDLYVTLGRAYVAAGRAHKAVELFQSCLAEIDRRAPANAVAYVRFATYLSYALSDMGELGRAREAVAKALERADEVADPYTRVRLYWSEARLAAAEGDATAGLQHLRRAVALLETTEDARHLGRAHLLTAEILTFEGKAAEAGRHLARAEQIFGYQGLDAEDLYWLRTEQARHAAESGRAEEAISKAREALRLMGDSDPAEQGAAYWALGEGLFTKGESKEAAEAFSRAVELLSSQRLWREALQAARSFARFLREAGRESEALDMLERTAELATRSGTVEAQVAKT
jgi:tetratricopeptide (TPR) repeat protein